MVQFHPAAQYRTSKRGLVVAGATGESALFEHPRAADLPRFLEDDPTDDALVDRLGPPLDADLLAQLREMHVLADHDADIRSAPTRLITRDGLVVPGIAVPARWIDTRLVRRSRAGTIAATVALVALALAGAASLLVGRPPDPQVSSTPALEAALMITLTLVGSVLHELGHAVAMVHFGRTPRRAGIGFYWGALSFFVDSSPAMTLPRRQRVVQALAGLVVDLGVVCVAAITAHLVRVELVQIVAWRLAILGLVEVLLNMLPFLELDGHWALADALDEPDLSARARRALGERMRGSTDDPWLARYGALSLVGGVVLVFVSAWVFWANTGHLVVALLTGNVAELLLGAYYVLPVAAALLLSLLGLVLETAMSRRDQ